MQPHFGGAGAVPKFSSGSDVPGARPDLNRFHTMAFTKPVCHLYASHFNNEVTEVKIVSALFVNFCSFEKAGFILESQFINDVAPQHWF
jgi:hypothetical protein